jgi:hypothetical protein
MMDILHFMKEPRKLSEDMLLTGGAEIYFCTMKPNIYSLLACRDWGVSLLEW